MIKLIITSLTLLLSNNNVTAAEPYQNENQFDMNAPLLNLVPPAPPGEFRREYPMTIAPPCKTTILPNEYLSLDLLVVIYTNCISDTVTTGELTVLNDEIAEAEEFFFRNSRCRFDLNITTIMIDRRLELNQFWLLSPPGGYWLPFWEVDGVHSVRNDLYDLGYYDNQFAGVFVYYAWANTDSAYAALGGGTYGVDVGFMGQTAFTSAPLCWDPATNDWYLIHEFHHQLDSMFDFSGYPDYPHADQPGNYDGGFDDGYSFNAWMLRAWPFDDWGGMSESWGTVLGFTDVDNDSLPDNGVGFTITENIFGSNPQMRDTDLDGSGDLSEAAAGYFAGSDPRTVDSDSDGVRDGGDTFPLDAVNTFLPLRSIIIDGAIDSAYRQLTSFSAPDPSDMSAELYGSYADTGLFLAVRVYDDIIETPWAEPWWDDGFYLQFDAANDGYLAHGEDNYSIYISPRGTRYNPTKNLAIIHPNGERDENFIPRTDLKAAFTINSGYYVIEMFLKENDLTGFTILPLDTVGLQIEIIDYDTYPGWPHYPAFTQFIDFVYQSLPGDANGSGEINGIDVVFLVNYLKGMGPAPSPLLSGDANGDCQANGLDVSYLVNYLKGFGPAPVSGLCP